MRKMRKNHASILRKCVCLALAAAFAVFPLTGCGKKPTPFSDGMTELAQNFLSGVVTPDLNTVINGSKKSKVVKTSLAETPSGEVMPLVKLASIVHLDAEEIPKYTKEQFGKVYDGVFPELDENQIRGEFFTIEVKGILSKYLPQIPVTGKWIKLEDNSCSKLTKSDNSTIYESVASYTRIYGNNYDEEDVYTYLYVKVAESGSDTVLEMQMYGTTQGENGLTVSKYAIKYIEGKLFYNYSNSVRTNTSTGKVDAFNLSLIHFERVANDGDEYVYGFNAYKNFQRPDKEVPWEEILDNKIYIDSYFGNEEVGFLKCGDTVFMIGQYADNEDVFLYKDGYLLASPYFYFKDIMLSKRDDIDRDRLNKMSSNVCISIDVEPADPSEDFWEDYLETYGFERKVSSEETYYENRYGYKIREADGKIEYEKRFFDEKGLPMIFSRDGYPLVADPFDGLDVGYYDAYGNEVIYWPATLDGENGIFRWFRMISGGPSAAPGDLIHIASVNIGALGYYNIRLPEYELEVFDGDEYLIPRKYDLGDKEVESYKTFYLNHNYVQYNQIDFSSLTFFTDNYQFFELLKYDGQEIINDEICYTGEYIRYKRSENDEWTDQAPFEWGEYESIYPSWEMKGAYLPVRLISEEDVDKYIVGEDRATYKFYVRYRDEFDRFSSLFALCPGFNVGNDIFDNVKIFDEKYYAIDPDKVPSFPTGEDVLSPDEFEPPVLPVLEGQLVSLRIQETKGDIVTVSVYPYSETELEKAKLKDSTFRISFGLYNVNTKVFYRLPFTDSVITEKDSTYTVYEMKITDFAGAVEAMPDGKYISVYRIEKYDEQSKEWVPYSELFAQHYIFDITLLAIKTKPLQEVTLLRDEWVDGSAVFTIQRHVVSNTVS